MTTYASGSCLFQNAISAFGAGVITGAGAGVAVMLLINSATTNQFHLLNESMFERVSVLIGKYKMDKVTAICSPR